MIILFLGCVVALSLSCSKLNNTTHEKFAESLYGAFKNNKRFSKPKLARSDFTICHYAGDVSFSYTFLAVDFCTTYVWIYRVSPS